MVTNSISHKHNCKYHLPNCPSKNLVAKLLHAPLFEASDHNYMVCHHEICGLSGKCHTVKYHWLRNHYMNNAQS